MQAKAEEQETWALLFSSRGHAVSCAADLGSALAMATHATPDIVLWRRDANPADEHAIVAKLRNTPAMRNALLLAVTPFPSQNLDNIAASSGYDLYLPGRLDVITLIRAIEGQTPAAATDPADTFARQGGRAAAVPNAVDTRSREPLQIPDEVRSAQAVLVHEFSQPMSALQNYMGIASYRLDREAGPESDSKAHFDAMRRMVSRLNQLMQLLRDEDLWELQPTNHVDRLVHGVVALWQCSNNMNQSVKIDIAAYDAVVSVAVARLLFTALMDLLRGFRDTTLLINLGRRSANDDCLCLTLRIDTAPGIDNVVKQVTAAWAIKYSLILAEEGAKIEFEVHSQGRLACTLLLPDIDKPEGAKNGAANCDHCN